MVDVWTLFFSTVTNYISRQTFSVLAPLISSQYHLTHTDLAKILGAFQISYAVTWLLGGIFLDAIGTRLGLALAVVFWSVINMLTVSLPRFSASRLSGSSLELEKALTGPEQARRLPNGFPARSAVSLWPSSIVAPAWAAPWQQLRSH